MRIVKLHTIDSTNDYLKTLVKDEGLTEDTLVWADHQTKGRGQMGTTWHTDKGKNLTFSIFRKVKRLNISEQFYATMAASLAVNAVLKKLLIKNIAVKWPNDILSDKQKICGILIESVIKKGQLDGMILGVGLNVNQLDFGDIPKATSIKAQTGIHFNLEEILNLLVDQFHQFTTRILEGKMDQIKNDYESHLFRKGKPSTFLRKNNEQFVGIIQGVTPQGKLILLEEDKVINEYDIKEIKLLF